MKILLAIDGSPHSQRAVDAVAGGLWPKDTVVEILTVVHPTVPILPDPAFVIAGIHEEQSLEQWHAAPELLERASREIVDRTEVTVETKTLEGSPKRVIVEEARTCREVQTKWLNGSDDQRTRCVARHLFIAALGALDARLPTAEAAGVSAPSLAGIPSARRHCCAARHASCRRASRHGLSPQTRSAATTPVASRALESTSREIAATSPGRDRTIV